MNGYGRMDIIESAAATADRIFSETWEIDEPGFLGNLGMGSGLRRRTRSYSNLAYPNAMGPISPVAAAATVSPGYTYGGGYGTYGTYGGGYGGYGNYSPYGGAGAALVPLAARYLHQATRRVLLHTLKSLLMPLVVFRWPMVWMICMDRDVGSGDIIIIEDIAVSALRWDMEAITEFDHFS